MNVYIIKRKVDPSSRYISESVYNGGVDLNTEGPTSNDKFSWLWNDRDFHLSSIAVYRTEVAAQNEVDNMPHKVAKLCSIECIDLSPPKVKQSQP